MSKQGVMQVEAITGQEIQEVLTVEDEQGWQSPSRKHSCRAKNKISSSEAKTMSTKTKGKGIMSGMAEQKDSTEMAEKLRQQLQRVNQEENRFTQLAKRSEETETDKFAGKKTDSAKAVSLLHSEDAGIKFRAVKKVANLAAKAKLIQEKSVEAWDMASLLMLLKSSENENTRGVAASAIANLAVNETNQKHIINQGGISLLSMTAADVEEPDHLFVVAAAIANLCGSAKFHTILSDKGGVKALLGMDKCGHQGVLAEVARGIANFAKCESRASTQGIITGRSILLDDGVLSWILQNAKNEASQIRGHIQLALCHLAQCEVNAKDMISGGALHELLHISLDCSEKDIKTLATQTLKSSPTFQSELQQLKD
ncbi:hypothetical protein IFM89_039633 [Coptis chinensis]|uniref:Vacuolar protein 8 n=1 Tax=Coptis chinensis TaxID=261450 RepID=A0A835GTA7_9MAGN|nr:hypothetical protein IFM89_039633 [Coptis chinensis]